ncbi:MAG: twin-arginine translocase TatA/TatE family subunit [Planctomycetota bacterium]
MFPGSIGYQELIIIGVVAVILFGGRLPSVARTLGQSYQQFRKGLSELQNSISQEGEESASSSYRPTYSDSTADFDDDEDSPDSSRFEPPA